VGELGSIFGEASPTGARGRDLHVEVSVPRGALGHAGGTRVYVPRIIHQDGERLVRVTNPGDAEAVTLHLPTQFASGSVLRLRGQGATNADGTPGDLYLRVQLVDGTAPLLAWWYLAAGTGGAVLGGAAWWLLALLQ